MTLAELRATLDRPWITEDSTNTCIGCQNGKARLLS